MNRRALLLGGAAVLAGCGSRTLPSAAPADLLERQLRAQEAVAAAYDGLRGREAAALATRAHARVNALLAALRAAGGTPPDPPFPPGTPTLQGALAAETRALRAHVAAVGLTEDHGLRELLADAIVSTAGSQAKLLALLGRDPLANPFPGEPA